MRRSLPLALVLLAAPLAATAHAGPRVCDERTIVRAMKDAGKSLDGGIGQIRCGDVTSDGARDAVFAVLSGGTAGPTHFGVVQGASETAGDGGLILYRYGYKLSIDRVSDHRFDVQQPFYDKNDANCCPSAYRHRPYRWNGQRFKAGKVRRTKKPQQRFF